MTTAAATRAVLGASSAAVAAFSLRQLAVHSAAYLAGSKHDLCGKQSQWAWSLNSDCFRTGFLWPALLLLAASSASAALAANLLLPGRWLSSNGFCSVGNREKSVRRPPGPVIMQDNRAQIGSTVVVLSVIQAALLAFGWRYDHPDTNFALAYPAIAAQLTVLITLASIVYLIVYKRSNSMVYAGLFPWPLSAPVLLQLAIGSCESYYSFFTPDTRNVPIAGRNASLRSNVLVFSTLISALLYFTYSRAQLRPVFVRPLPNSASQQHAGYVLADTEIEDDDDEATPLARRTEKKPAALVDSPEFSASWYSALAFSWTNDMIGRGARNQLEPADLYRLDDSDMPVPNWRRYLRHRKPGRSLMVAILMTFAPELTAQCVLALITAFLRFSGPFFLQRILRSIEVLGSNSADHGGPAEKSIRSAYLDAFGLLLFTLITGALSHQTLWIGRHIGIRLKGLMVAELSSKTLRRRGKGSWDDKKETAEDADDEQEDGAEGAPAAKAAADGKIMNLLTADFSRVTEVASYLDNVYSMPLELFIGIWYMYMLLGMSALIGLSMAVVYFPLSKMLFQYVTKVEQKLTSLSDERVTVITELLQGIKAVKLFGWESRFLEMVDQRRERQLVYMWKLLIAWVRVTIASSVAPMLVLVVIFAFYVIVLGNKLTAEIAFTSISVFAIIRMVFEHLPGFLSWAIGGYVSLGRIDAYLGQPQVQDLESRVAPAAATTAATYAKLDGSGDLIGDEDLLGFEDADLEWERPDDAAKPDNKNVVSSDAPTGGVESTSVGTPIIAEAATEQTPLLVSAAAAVAAAGATGSSHTQIVLTSASASNTSLNGSEDDGLVSFALKNINVRFPHGALSIVAGPTGSGKSSLLSALIGEMTLTRGRIHLPTTNSGLTAGDSDKYRDIIELSDEGLAIREIAYVAQEAWLRNATIRENILFGEQYEKSRYEEVLRVCALKPDLRILSAGDQTEIGERGVTLSGGQKQRVALARAVYSSRRILLIDDCLSAVDAHTAKHILTECLLSKTPLMLGRTRVLVTHHVSMCLPFAQYVVMLREGEVSLKGHPQELQSQGVFTKVLAELESSDDKSKAAAASNSAENKLKGKEPEQDVLDADVLDEDDPAKSVNDPTSEDEYNQRRLKKIAEQRGLDPSSDLSALQGSLVEDEERETGYVKAEVWLTYLNACGNKWFWIISIALLTICQISLVLQDYWIRIWVASTNTATTDGYSSNALPTKGHSAPFGFMWPLLASPVSALVAPLSSLRASMPIYNSYASAGLGANGVVAALSDSEQKQHSAIYWIGIYVAIGIAGLVWRVIQMCYVYSGAIRASRSLHSRLLRRVVRATPRFFDSTPLGRIINRFSRDMYTVDEQTADTIVWWSCDILAVLSVFAIITAVTPAFIFVAAFVSLLYAAIAYYYLSTSRELKRLESNSMSPLLSLFGELILGVSTIRAFGAKHYYVKEALNRINTHNQPFYMVWSTNRWLSIRIDLAGAIVSFACALFILTSLDWLDAGLAGFALTYALTFSERMLWVIRNYSSNELNMNAIERVGQYLKLEQEAALHSLPENKSPADWPKTGSVQIDDLVIEYVPGVPVLHGISLSASHGEKIGVVGRTGAGKSTMSLAFLRFIEAARGRILLDNVDISKIGLEELRRNVTIIPQDPVLFNGTIRFNLDPFGEYPDELVWDALKRAHLVRERGSQVASTATSVFEGNDSANEAGMERMSGIFTGLDAEIKENGQNLSLGQRQLVALARALVRRSRLIIMDEATASVDFDTDDRIQRTIRGPEFANSTLFCIAHRLRTIIDYDRVLVLDKGKVAEFDTPWNLLQSEGSIFRSMCEKSGEYEHLVAAAQRKSQ